MLVNSTKEVNHLDDLLETFYTLRLYDMKPNPNKCVFGVVSGIFLSFMVSQHGMKANLDKVQAVIEMAPPKSAKEVQNLNGKVTTLNRFISRAMDKCLPLFKELRKAFEWTNEC